MMRRIFARLLILVLIVSSFSNNGLYVKAEEKTETYQYALLSLSTDNALMINAKGGNVSGYVASNANIEIGNLNNNGKLYENESESLPLLLDAVYEKYFSEAKDEKLIADVKDVVDLNDSVRAIGDITIKGQSINGDNLALVSEAGDITVNCDNLSLTGFIYAPHGNVIMSGDNINLNRICIIADVIKISANNVNIGEDRDIISWVDANVSYDEEEVVVYAYGEYEDNSINISWFTNSNSKSVEIFESNDNETFSKVAIVTNEESYNYSVSEDFEKKYIKVKIRNVSSIPFVVTKTSQSYEISLLDSDKDGIEDIFEEMYGTDLNKEDTDEDGLSDYEEIMITLTDPKVFDSFEKGKADGNVDMDEDGIDNKTEVLLKTNPLEPDTDNDTLSDYDEVNVYHTNPTVEDTDGDGLLDASEVKLGTDPLNPDTDDNGVLDGDEVFKVVLSKDSFEDSIFEKNVAIPSIVLNQKGDSCKDVKCSEYNGYLKGDGHEFIGKCIEVTGEGKISGKISFTLGDGYSIPKYKNGDYETNGLIICQNTEETTTPLQTRYDEKTRTLSADLNNGGIYFVMDVVYWLDSLGIDWNDVLADLEAAELDEEPEEVVKLCSSEVRMMGEPQSKGVSDLGEAASHISSDVSIAGKAVSGQVDIVFVIDTTGSMRNSINNVKNNINGFVDALVKKNIKPYFSLVEYRDITCDGAKYTNAKINPANNTCWFSSTESFKKQIAALTVDGGGDIPETAIDGLEFARRLNLRSYSQKFFILVTDAGYKVDNNYNIKDMDEMISLLVHDKITTSVITSNSDRSTYSSLYETTGGIYANISSDFKNALLGIADNIIDKTNDGNWIVLNGLTPLFVKLDAKPTFGSKVDTDKDKVTDANELGSTIPIKKYNALDYIGKLSLLTSQTRPIPSNVKLPKWDIYVYNYISNPAKQDTDSDGLDDLLDNKPKDSSVHSFLIYDCYDNDIKLKEGTSPNPHNDYVYGDKSKKQLKKMSWISWADFFLTGRGTYKMEWKMMVSTLTLFSTHAMKKAAKSMINHFIDGTGDDYRNGTLDNEIADHKNTKTYVSKVKTGFEELIKENNGNILGLKYDESLMQDEVKRNSHPMIKKLKGVYQPVYNDKTSGLGICVDGLLGNRIEVTSYSYKNGKYNYTLKFTFYDIYGLDESDITDDYGMKVPFGVLAGFRAWYILQHYDKYKGDYRPYVTYMEYETN